MSIPPLLEANNRARKHDDCTSRGKGRSPLREHNTILIHFVNNFVRNNFYAITQTHFSNDKGLLKN